MQTLYRFAKGEYINIHNLYDKKYAEFHKEYASNNKIARNCRKGQNFQKKN